MPSRLEEASQASEAYQLALTQIGLQTVGEALTIWRQNTPSERDGTATRWLALATAMVLHRRGKARDLAFAYYRLARALITGSTVKRPGDKAGPSQVTLGVLRHEFESLLSEPSEDTTTGLAPEAEQDEPTPSQLQPASAESADSPTPGRVARQRPAVGVDLDEEALDEEVLQEDELEEATSEEVEEEVASALQSLGSRNLAKKNERLDTSKPASEVDAERKINARQSGARQAASASRQVMNGARKEVWDLHDKDQKALGYIRVSTTGTPCGFCTMLISRGPVYKDAKSAGFGDGNLFHDNCYCIAIPVWSDEQFNDDPQFALNHLYMEQWPRVTRGLSGKAALSAWRRFIRQEQVSKPVSAQAA